MHEDLSVEYLIMDKRPEEKVEFALHVNIKTVVIMTSLMVYVMYVSEIIMESFV